jgi:hypothetical protein
MGEIIHSWVAMAGPVIALFGLVMSMWGTFLLTREYHPLGGKDFFRELADSPMAFLAILTAGKGRNIPGDADARDPKPNPADQALDELKKTVQLAEVRPEKRYLSLVGILMIFWGFLLQGLGTLASVVDIIWTHRATFF